MKCDQAAFPRTGRKKDIRSKWEACRSFRPSQDRENAALRALWDMYGDQLHASEEDCLVCADWCDDQGLEEVSATLRIMAQTSFVVDQHNLVSF